MLSNIEAIDRIIKLLNDAIIRAEVSMDETEDYTLQECYRNYTNDFIRTRSSLYRFKELLNNDDLVIKNPTKE